MGRRGEDYERVALLEARLQQQLPEEKFLFELGKQMLNRPLPKKKDDKAKKAGQLNVTTSAQASTSDDSIADEE